MRHERSARLFERACKVIPGGVSSPVRAFGAVGGKPLFLARGEGPHVFDADGNRYIDFVGSWGPLILGHADADVVAALQEAAKDGSTFGAATSHEVALAERICSLVPSIERIRFVSSGTEATMSALRLARGFTGRSGLIKFAGCYHGHGDAFLAEAGSGVATLGIPGSPGVPEATVSETLTLPFNDLAKVEEALAAKPEHFAAIFVEPLPCNMGMVTPDPDFLLGLQALAAKYGCLFVCDEVITGFRVGLRGAQGLYGLRPDLSTYGKIMGGGLPAAAYGGRADIMAHIAPEGPVYQAGTLSGNPLAMVAGLATLERLMNPETYMGLDEMGALLEAGLNGVLERFGHPARLSRLGSIFHLWFCAGSARAPKNYADIAQADTALFARFFHGMLAKGVALAPSAYEVGFISTKHTSEHIEATITAAEQTLREMTA